MYSFPIIYYKISYCFNFKVLSDNYLNLKNILPIIINFMIAMIEKIEITQRFNFKKLNRHYECFIIDFINNSAYYKISERGAGDKFLKESYLCDDSWIAILVDLRENMTSKIYKFENNKKEDFLKKFHDLELFDNFKSEKFSYFEKLESIYSCNVIIYSSDNYEEYSFKNNFPAGWIRFGKLLKELVNFDVLHLNHQKYLATPLFYDIRSNGIFKDNEKLNLKVLEFGHFKCYPYELPHPNFIIDFENAKIDGYLEKEIDTGIVLDLLEKYAVYRWIFKDYQLKASEHDPEDLEGYEWYLEMLFENNVIWHFFGYNDYPDTYVHLAEEVRNISDFDLLEIESIPRDEIDLLKKYGNKKLA